MEDYEAFCNHARVYTEVHARPNAAQRAVIEERNQKEALNSVQETQKPATTKTEMIITLKPQLSPSSGSQELEENKEGLRQKVDVLMTENNAPSISQGAGSV